MFLNRLSTETRLSLARRLFPPILVFVLSACVYAQFGFGGALSHDHAIYLYAGQKMAEGVPPYVSIFDHKGPLAPMIAGLAITISDMAGWNADLFAVRLGFSIVGCFAVTSIYSLGSNLFRSQRAGFFAALTFLGFFGFAHDATSGPEPKVPMVLFETLSLLLTSQRRWFLAGVCGALSFLIWQPMAIFPLVTIFLAGMVPRREERIAAIVRAVAGVGLPLIAVGMYFYHHGAFYKLLDGFIFSNVVYGDRGPSLVEAPLGHIARPVRVASVSFGAMFLPMLIGFVMIGYAYLSRARLFLSSGNLLTRDAFAPILLTFPAPVLWSLLDFQARADFYVFLPYAAIGFGMFAHLALRGIEGSRGAATARGTQRSLTVMLSMSLVALAVSNAFDEDVKTSREGFAEQEKAARQIEDGFGSNARLVSVGAPQLLVLLHKTNPTPYAFIKNGIDSYIQEKTPGGFEGWLKETEAYDPDVVVFSQRTTTRMQKEHEEQLKDWLQNNYRETQVGPWSLYVNDSAGDAADSGR